MSQPTYPLSGQKQLWTLLHALLRGERLTVAVALSEYGCYALSQRCGQLRGLGWPIQSRMVKTSNGKTVAEYWLEPETVRQRPLALEPVHV